MRAVRVVKCCVMFLLDVIVSHVESLQFDHLGQGSKLVYFVVRNPELLQSVPHHLKPFTNISFNICPLVTSLSYQLNS